MHAKGHAQRPRRRVLRACGQQTQRTVDDYYGNEDAEWNPDVPFTLRLTILLSEQRSSCALASLTSRRSPCRNMQDCPLRAPLPFYAVYFANISPEMGMDYLYGKAIPLMVERSHCCERNSSATLPVGGYVQANSRLMQEWLHKAGGRNKVDDRSLLVISLGG